MADIRINALATTAASTASDDFVAVDGSANGTRKLNAYSPTFGGNLTVSGTATFNGSSVAFANSAAPAGPNIKFENIGGSTQLSETASSSFYYKAYSHNFLSLAGTSLMALSNAGNLTVSGTGTSSVAGNLGIGETSPVVPLHVKTTGTGTGDFDNAIATLRSTAAGRTITLQFSDTTNQSYISSKSGALNFGVGGAVLGMSLSSGGNLLIGGTIDSSNGNLQLKDTSGSSTKGIGFGTDTALYRVYNGELVLSHVGGTNPYLYLNENGTNTAQFSTNGGNAELGTTVAGKSLTLKTAANTTALTLDSSQNATFAGTSVTVDGASTGSTLTLKRASNANGAIISYKTTTTSKWYHGLRGLVDDNWYLQNDVAGNTALFFDASTSNATFAGSIAIGNTVQTAVSVASTHKVTISIGGTTYYLLATNV